MSGYPNRRRYRGAYDYDYTYPDGQYDYGDRGAWSSPGYAYDEYDPRPGRAPWRPPTYTQVQSAYADYYTEPQDYSAPASQPSVSYDHASSHGHEWKQEHEYDVYTSRLQVHEGTLNY